MRTFFDRIPTLFFAAWIALAMFGDELIALAFFGNPIEAFGFSLGQSWWWFYQLILFVVFVFCIFSFKILNSPTRSDSN